ncbi:MAG TPA: MFS transporter [Tepidiformaceae bacterium]
MEWTDPRLESRLFKSYPYPLALAIFLLQIALGIILLATFQVFVPDELGTSDAWPGYLLGAYGAARFVFETPTGAISDRIERRLGLLIGFACMLPAILLMLFVQDSVAYLLFASFLGLGTAFIWPATYAISADLYPPDRRGKVIGFLNLAQLLGLGVGTMGGAFLVQYLSPTQFLAALGAISGAFVAALIGVPNYRGGRTFGRIQSERRPSVWSLMSFQLAVLSALILATSVAMSMLIPAIRPLGEQELGISFAMLIVALIPAIVVGALLYVPAGHLSDRFGRTGPFLGGQIMVVVGLVVISSAGWLPVAMLGAIILVTGNVVSVPAWNAAIMDLAPVTHRGTLIGLSVALSGLGLAIGPALGGLVLEAANPPAVFNAAAILSALAGAGIFAYGRAFAQERTVALDVAAAERISSR